MSAYSTAVQAESSLVAYWQLDEPSGTSAADSKGTYTGTYTNSPTLNQTALGLLGGSAVTLASASSQYVTIADNAALRGLSGLTIECWVKFTSLPGTDVLFTLVGKVGCYYLVFRDEGGTKKFQLSGNATDGALKVNWTPSTGVWYHVALTWQSGTNNTKVYVNGSSVGSGTQNSAMPTAANELTIGRFNSTFYLDGTIDEVALYNTALSSSSILAHYQAGAQATRTVTADAIISPRNTSTVTADGLVEYGTRRLRRVLTGDTQTGSYVRIYGATTGNAYRVYDSGGSTLESVVADSNGLVQFTSAVNGGTRIVGFTDNTYATSIEGQWWRGTVATGNVFDAHPDAIPTAGINPISTTASYYYPTSQYGSRGPIVTTATKTYMLYATGDGGTAYGGAQRDIVAVRLDNTTGLIDQGPTTVRTNVADGHEIYVLQREPSGKLRFIYGGQGAHLYVRESTSADDITAWGSAVQISTATSMAFAGTYMVDSNGNNHIIGSQGAAGSVLYGYASSANTTAGTWTWTTVASGNYPWSYLFGDAVLQESGGTPYIHACFGCYDSTGILGTLAYRYAYYVKLTGGSTPTAAKASGSSITLPMTQNASTGAVASGDEISSVYHYGYWFKIAEVSGTPCVLLDNDRNSLPASNVPGSQTVATWNGSSWSSNTISELIMWGTNPNTSDPNDTRSVVNSNFGVNIQSRGSLVYVYGAIGNPTLQDTIDTGHTGFRLQRFKSTDGFATYTIDNIVEEGYGAFTYTDLNDGSSRPAGANGAGFCYPKVPDDPATVMFGIVDQNYATLALSSLSTIEFTADAIIKTTSAVTADAIIVGRLTSTFTSDAIIRDVAVTRTYTADAVVTSSTSSTTSRSYTADGRIKATLTATYTVDARVSSSTVYPITYTMRDTYARFENEGSRTAPFAFNTGSLTADFDLQTELPTFSDTPDRYDAGDHALEYSDIVSGGDNSSPTDILDGGDEA